MTLTDTQTPESAPRTVPETAEALIMTARRALAERDFAATQAALAKAAALAPSDADVLHVQGLLFVERDRDAASGVTLLRAAAARKPDRVDFQHNLATVEVTLGEFAVAEKRLRDTLQRKPDYTEAWHTLAGIRKFTPDDPLIAAMEAQARTGNFQNREAGFLCFALGKAYDDTGRYDDAFSLYDQGNRFEGHTFDLGELEAAVALCEQTFTPALFAARKADGHPTTRPMLVVGMPRSGTTLVEALMGRHPDIVAAGELPALEGVGQILAQRVDVPAAKGHARALKAANRLQMRAAARGYLDFAHRRCGQAAERVVDKMPDNSFNLGLAVALMPDIRIVHVMRHPLDVAVSIYFQRFSRGIRYGFDLAVIGRYYRLYARMMEHWRRVIPAALLEVRYEDVISAEQASADRLVAFAGLDPSESAERAAPAETGRAVNTASRWQVRQPVYTTSRERWRRYAAHLGPVIEAMGGMDWIEAEVERQKARADRSAAMQQTRPETPRP